MSGPLTKEAFLELSPEDKMRLRMKVAAEVVDFAEGTLIEVGEEFGWQNVEVKPAQSTQQSANAPRLNKPTIKTFSASPDELEKSWIVIDAEGLLLGRLASIVAMRLRGKHKANFTPHMDLGDNVIVVNADKILVTGLKQKQPYYYWHTGHPGGTRRRTSEQILEGKHPERIVIQAVKRMMPGGRLSRLQMASLRVYAGTEHPHLDQNPDLLEVDSNLPAASGTKKQRT